MADERHLLYSLTEASSFAESVVPVEVVSMEHCLCSTTDIVLKQSTLTSSVCVYFGTHADG